MATSSTDITLVTWKRPEITELVIKTLAKNTITPSRLIVVDNGSGEEMQKMLKGLKKLGLIDELVLLPENIGLEPARNIALSKVTTPLFVATDSDCLPEKPNGDEDWLSKLIDLIKRYSDYAAIAARTQVMIGTGDIFEGHEDEDIVEFSHPGGSLRLMRTDIVKRIGGWRDDVPSRGQEEMYICNEIRKHGYRAGFAVDVNCYHMFGDSNWGYSDLEPEEHGHKPVWHPAIINGDDIDEVRKFI